MSFTPPSTRSTSKNIRFKSARMKSCNNSHRIIKSSCTTHLLFDKIVSKEDILTKVASKIFLPVLQLHISSNYTWKYLPNIDWHGLPLLSAFYEPKKQEYITKIPLHYTAACCSSLTYDITLVYWITSRFLDT